MSQRPDRPIWMSQEIMEGYTMDQKKKKNEAEGKHIAAGK